MAHPIRQRLNLATGFTVLGRSQRAKCAGTKHADVAGRKKAPQHKILVWFGLVL